MAQVRRCQVNLQLIVVEMKLSQGDDDDDDDVADVTTRRRPLCFLLLDINKIVI